MFQMPCGEGRKKEEGNGGGRDCYASTTTLTLRFHCSVGHLPDFMMVYHSAGAFLVATETSDSPESHESKTEQPDFKMTPLWCRESKGRYSCRFKTFQKTSRLFSTASEGPKYLEAIDC